MSQIHVFFPVSFSHLTLVYLHITDNKTQSSLHPEKLCTRAKHIHNTSNSKRADVKAGQTHVQQYEAITPEGRGASSSRAGAH